MIWHTDDAHGAATVTASGSLSERFDSIIMLSPFAWDGPWQTLHYFATHLSSMLPVIYVEPSPPWDPRLPGFRLGPLLRARRIVEPSNRLSVARPQRLPLARFQPLHQASERLFVDVVRETAEAHNLRRPLFWAAYYTGVVRHLELLDAGHYVYHSLDYFDHPEESRLATEADIVLAVSRPLQERQRARNPHVFLIPNGVAMDWVGPPASGANGTAAPQRRRTIGFVGTLNRNVDFGLLLLIARRHTDVDLEIVGPLVSKLPPAQYDAFEALKREANVRMLGFRPPQELFALIAQHDVCVLPFLDSQWISHSDPIKFYQYLALGKPVVTTPVPAALRCRRLCYVAASHPSFLASIEAALGEGGGQARLRIRVAAAHDWKRLVRRAHKLVDMTLRSTPEAASSRASARAHGTLMNELITELRFNLAPSHRGPRP